MSLRLGQFMDALAIIESDNDYEMVDPRSGAFGKYGVMPKNWTTWGTTFWGAPREPSIAHQEQLAVWKVAKMRATIRLRHLTDSLTRIYQRLAAAWRSGMSVGQADPATWSAGTQKYVASMGLTLTALGFEGW